MDIRIEAATEADFPYLVGMFRLLREEEGHPIEDDAWLCQRMQTMLNDGAHQCSVVNDDEQTAIAYMLFTQLENGVCLKHIFVQPNYRRQGIARALISNLKQECQDGHIILEVLPQNEEAIAFYRALGFQLHSYVYKYVPNE